MWDAVRTEGADRAPQTVQVLTGALEAATAVLVWPERYRQRPRTTHAQERLHAAIRRRERGIRMFPSRGAATRLLGALLLEIHEQGTTGTRSLARDDDAAWCAARAVHPATGTMVAMR